MTYSSKSQRKVNGGCQALGGRGKEREQFIGTEFQFYEIKNVLWVAGGDGYPAMGMYLLPLNSPPKNG